MSEPGAPGPERVRSGGFQIDRKRALELLARYQLQSPLHFPLAWVRAAVAAGAGSIELFDAKELFTLEFDGRPYAAAELSALLACLPEENADPRLRELARGTAAALPHVTAVVVRSGKGSARGMLRATMEGEIVERIDEPRDRTIVAAHWGARGRPPGFRAVLETLERRCFPGLLGGRGAPRLPAGTWQPFEQEGARGWLAPGGLEKLAEIHLHQLGVNCGTVAVELNGHAQVRAVVDSADLRLDLSQGSCLRDERYDEVLGRLGRGADAFARDAARRLALALPLIGDWLRDPVAYTRWKEKLIGKQADEGLDGVFLEAQRYFALDAGSAAERVHELERWAPIVAWLRETALRLLGDGRKPRSELERALWQGPLYLTVEGLPASIEELERQRLRFGRVTVAERAYSGEPPLPPAVELSDRRGMLRLLLGPTGDRLNP